MTGAVGPQRVRYLLSGPFQKSLPNANVRSPPTTRRGPAVPCTGHSTRGLVSRKTERPAEQGRENGSSESLCWAIDYTATSNWNPSSRPRPRPRPPGRSGCGRETGRQDQTQGGAGHSFPAPPNRTPEWPRSFSGETEQVMLKPALNHTLLFPSPRTSSPPSATV